MAEVLPRYVERIGWTVVALVVLVLAVSMSG